MPLASGVDIVVYIYAVSSSKPCMLHCTKLHKKLKITAGEPLIPTHCSLKHVYDSMSYEDFWDVTFCPIFLIFWSLPKTNLEGNERNFVAFEDNIISEIWKVWFCIWIIQSCTRWTLNWQTVKPSAKFIAGLMPSYCLLTAELLPVISAAKFTLPILCLCGDAFYVFNLMCSQNMLCSMKVKLLPAYFKG